MADSGIHVKGVKKIVELSNDTEKYKDYFLRVYYNAANHKMWHEYCKIDDPISWNYYYGPNVMEIADLFEPVKMDWLRQRVAEALEERAKNPPRTLNPDDNILHFGWPSDTK